MNNQPFRFLDSADSVSRLCSRLSAVGLDSCADGAGESELRFTCRWLTDTAIALRWHYNWWPDGVNQEDATVELVVDNEPITSVDVDMLLNRPLERPLHVEITDRIVGMASSFTGKSA